MPTTPYPKQQKSETGIEKPRKAHSNDHSEKLDGGCFVPMLLRRADTRTGAREVYTNGNGPKHDSRNKFNWTGHVCHPVVSKNEEKHSDEYRTAN